MSDDSNATAKLIPKETDDNLAALLHAARHQAIQARIGKQPTEVIARIKDIRFKNVGVDKPSEKNIVAADDSDIQEEPDQENSAVKPKEQGQKDANQQPDSGATDQPNNEKPAEPGQGSNEKQPNPDEPANTENGESDASNSNADNEKPADDQPLGATNPDGTHNYIGHDGTYQPEHPGQRPMNRGSAADNQQPVGATNPDGTPNYINPRTGQYQRERPAAPSNYLKQLLPGEKEAWDKTRERAKKLNMGREMSPELGQMMARNQAPGTEGNAYTGLGQSTDQSAIQAAGKGLPPDKLNALNTNASGKKNLAGKKAAEALGQIAEMGMAGSAVIYCLAIFNDFPDLLDPLIDFGTGGLWAIINFFLDAVVFVGFRYFLRQHINNVPGLKMVLYVCSAAELLPIPFVGIDFFPFWIICAWVALRKIKAHQAQQQAQAMADQANAKAEEEGGEQTPGWARRLNVEHGQAPAAA